MVNNPAVQVTDVAVNSKSSNGIEVVRDMGNDNNAVPAKIVIIIEEKNIWAGVNLKRFFLFIAQLSLNNYYIFYINNHAAEIIMITNNATRRLKYRSIYFWI